MGEEKWFNICKKREKISKFKYKDTFIEKTFGGYLVNYLKCLGCKKISRTFDFFMDLSVQIPGSREIVQEARRRKQRKRSKEVQVNSKREEVKEELQKEEEQNVDKFGKDDVYQYVEPEEIIKSKIPNFI